MEKAKAEAEKANAEAEKEKDEVEQHGYDISVVETEEAFRAEVPVVCRAYCSQIWEEALNRAGIDASSKLRRPKNVFFPPTIRAPDLAPNQKEIAPSSCQVSRGCSVPESSPSQSAGASHRT